MKKFLLSLVFLLLVVVVAGFAARLSCMMTCRNAPGSRHGFFKSQPTSAATMRSRRQPAMPA